MYSNILDIDQYNYSKIYTFESLRSTLGIDPSIWDRPTRSHVCGMLTQLISVKIKEIKAIPNRGNTSENEIEGSSNSIEEMNNPRNMYNNKKEETGLFNGKSIKKADFEFVHEEFKVEAYSKRYIGKQYKYPLEISLISIPRVRLIGVRVNFYIMESLKNSSIYMPLLPQLFNEEVLNKKEQETTSFISEYTKLFKEKSNEISYNHITVNEAYKFDIRQSRNSKKMYSVSRFIVVPFEILIHWNYMRMLQSNAEINTASMRRKSRRQTRDLSNMMIHPQNNMASKFRSLDMRQL